jgi:hypothetical protein
MISRLPLIGLCYIALSQPALANDWEKFYTPLPGSEATIPSDIAPEIVPSTGDIEADLESMWRRGFAPIGYTSFETGNSKTRDGERLAKKLRARFLIVDTNLVSSRSSSVPLTTPNTTTTISSGNVQAQGTGGSAVGTYSGTSTTYGSSTTYIPVQINRFSKTAVYFREAPKIGTGVFSRDLTPQEVSRHETRRAFAVRFVRDGSPAYIADLLPGDVILRVNGNAADDENWQAAARGQQPMQIELSRNGSLRKVELSVPDEWKPKTNPN